MLSCVYLSMTSALLPMLVTVELLCPVQVDATQEISPKITSRTRPLSMPESSEQAGESIKRNLYKEQTLITSAE